MGTVRIAHLSDLHFAPEKQDDKVWSKVRDFLNAEVQAHAVLVTGDVTDSATAAEFNRAREALDTLMLRPVGGDCEKYRIVAGNHDRFLYRGNQPPPGIARLFRRFWPRDKRARFDHAFPGATQVTPRSHCDMTLFNRSTGAAAADWKIRIIGLDSSANSRWFAQGCTSQSDIATACDAAAKATGHDLVIALVHHHILPIPAVEQRAFASGGLMQVLNATGMLNAGALIEALSRTQVDLVLHGHEHAPHQARFAGSDELATNVALLAAGSATGDETLKGWALNRVHFNVVELEDDRSVWLRQVDGSSGELAFRPGRKLILNADDIRVSRFVRRNRQTAGSDRQIVRKLPQSRLRKVVEFCDNRDIRLAESRTDWYVSGGWSQRTHSGSGIVGAAIVDFEWADGENRSYAVEATAVPGEPDHQSFDLSLAHDRQARLARRVTARWGWTGAAAFTRAELDMLPPTAHTGPRRRGEEFASIRCGDEFEELVLSVRLPLAWSPPPETIKVYYETAEAPGQPVYADELRRSLNFCGPGNIDLRVPYPMPGYRYGISWPVLAADMRHPMASAMAQRLLERLPALAPQMTSLLAARGWTSSARWGVYVPDHAQPSRMLRVRANGLPAGYGGVDQLPLQDARGLARAAFWGDAVVARKDKNNNRYELLPDEVLLGFLAVRARPDTSCQALAILRIAFISDPVGQSPESEWAAEFKAHVGVAALTLGMAVSHP